MTRALIGCILSGLIGGLMGAFVVKLNLTSIGYCMSHAAFAGSALGIAMSLNPLAVALLFSSIVAGVIGPVADKARMHAEAIIGITFSLNMALAWIFLSLAPGIHFTSQTINILWGSVMAISNIDMVLLLALCTATVASVLIFWKEFYAITFNRRLAEADGIPTKPFVYAIIFIAGVAVTLSLKLVGGVLVFALLFNPASTAFQFLLDMKKIILASPIIGASTCVAGLLLSLVLDWPVGSSIVVVSTLTFMIAVIFSPKRRREVSEAE